MINKKFILIIFSLCIIVIITGCSGGGLGDLIGGSESGLISGTITYNGADPTGTGVVGTLVYLLNQDPSELNMENEDFNSFIENATEASMTINSENGSYTFDDLDAGTYYVVAYKDVNGNETLDIEEVQEQVPMGVSEGEGEQEGPTDPAGFYVEGDSEEPSPIIITGEEEFTTIDFTIESSADTCSISGVVLNIDQEAMENMENDPSPLTSQVTVNICGTVNTVAQINTTNGNFSFDFIYPGTYYFTIENIPDGYLPTRTFHYSFKEGTDTLDIPLLDEQLAKDTFDYTEGNPLIGGEVQDINNQIDGATIQLSSGVVGYFNDTGDLLWSDTNPEADTGEGGMFFIKNANTGTNRTINVTKTGYSFEEQTLDIVNDWLTYGKIFGSAE